MNVRRWIVAARRHRRGGGTPAASNYASDALTDANTTVLRSHSPVAVGANPAGTSWTDANGVFNDLTILNNRLLISGVATSGTFTCHMGAAGTPAANQEVLADLTMFTLLPGQIIGIGARCSGGGSVGGYYLSYIQSDPPTFQLISWTDGFALAQIGSLYNFPFPVSGTVVPVVLRCVGTTISADINGVANAITGTTGVSITGRLAGVRCAPAASGTNSTAATGVHVDNIVLRSAA